MNTLKDALIKVASLYPELRSTLVPFLARNSSDETLNLEMGIYPSTTPKSKKEASEEDVKEEGEEGFDKSAGRKFSPGVDKSRQNDYGEDLKGDYSWNPKNKKRQKKKKCYYQTRKEEDRCYVTTNGGPGGQKKPKTAPAGKDGSKERQNYNKKYRKQRNPNRTGEGGSKEKKKSEKKDS